ncbi:2-iminoacetate synthase [Austwickia sp. TVS 96-490-7B]|uniref:2-iminoacetate synthase ThiH n=1 Tax=Austwickia sp. TVS 96-490-7B TaxID=2830843 RepID=UPI001C585678|nr:2-iminoacetate synthase ThiH [Austwickia sp. TVS 96-490-7B]MBW3084276.1 2-iminoacetate synthase [Austwickia sp. TVS 96-490-7B]
MGSIAPVPLLARRADGRTDPMDWRAQHVPTGSGIMAHVLATARTIDFEAFDASSVRAAVTRSRRTTTDLAALLSPAAAPLIEEIAAAAQQETRARFGTTVGLFTPLYISNYCQNICTYCGFSANQRITRVALTPEGIDAELRAIAATGLQEILILTGESTKYAGAPFIAAAVHQATRYFPTVGIEVQPLTLAEYRQIHEAGADFVSVYQETYDVETYDRCHPGGAKRQFPWRFESPERALTAGMHGVNFGALLGLADFRRDAFTAAVHAATVQREFPQAEIGFSVPRLRPIVGGQDPLGTTAGHTRDIPDVHERDLLQVMCAYRLFLPSAGITISTRERPGFRDGVLGLVANRSSAGVSTGVGEHATDDASTQVGDEQFDIADDRSVAQMCDAIRARGLQPVMSDHLRLTG